MRRTGQAFTPQHGVPREVSSATFSLLYNSVAASEGNGAMQRPAGTLGSMSDSAAPLPLSASQALHVRWSDVPVEPMNPLLSRAFITGAQAMIARIELKKGCVVPRHSHPNEQVAWVTEGMLIFVLGESGDEQRVTVRAGEVLVIPGGLPHSAEALEDTVDYDIFAPPRQDWIQKDDAYLR